MYPAPLISAVLAALLFSAAASSRQGADDEAGDKLEEVIVYGEKPLWRLRRDIELAEDRFYDLFNELNNDPDFHVTCQNEAPTGSHIRRRVCRTRLERELFAAEAQGELRLNTIGRRGAVGVTTFGEVRHINSLLRDRMASMAKENGQVFRAILQIGAARQIYEAEKERRKE